MTTPPKLNPHVAALMASEASMVRVIHATTKAALKQRLINASRLLRTEIDMLMPWQTMERLTIISSNE